MRKYKNIFYYYRGARLRELAKDFPQYKIEIEERISRIQDLMIPFREKAYYDPAMNGSHSIKYVLPALVPELSYNTLPINNGGLAMVRAVEVLEKIV